MACASGKLSKQTRSAERFAGKAAEVLAPEQEADAALGLQKLQEYIKECGAHGVSSMHHDKCTQMC